MRYSIRKLFGSKQAENGRDVVLGFNSPEGDVELQIDPNMLISLALEAMHARSAWERNQPSKANTELHALIVERWEIRRSAAKNGLLLGLKIAGGAWVRFEVPRNAFSEMHETVEIAEGRRPTPPTPMRKN